MLLQNDGHGGFTNIASEYGATGSSGHSIGSAWGDIDNDGHLDLFVGNFSHAGQPQSQWLRNGGPDARPETPFAFENKGTGGVMWQESFASPSLGDYDNDGDLDLFFTTVYGGNSSVLYRNDGDWNFSNVSSSEGLPGFTSTYQNAWGDYDNDGDLDLISGGRLFRNDLDNNHTWLKLHLQGDPLQGINAAAIGAVARVRLGGETTLTRQVEGGTGEGNQNDLTLHFGLGNHFGSVDVEITWPDGTTQTLQADPNQTLRIPYQWTPALSEVEVGEVGQITSLTHQVQTVFLNRLYDHPVVFAQSASFHGDDPVVVRVANVQPDQFDIFLAEPSNENGIHNAGETVPYLVLEAGNHHLPDGTRLEVGTVETTDTVGNQLSNQWQTIEFTTGFDATPVVLSQVQTQSALGADFLWTRHQETTATGVTLALEQEEAAMSAHPAETIGYLAIDSGVGSWNNMLYQARTKNFIGTHEFNQIRYSTPFETVPSLLVSLTSYFGHDNAHLRYTNPTASGMRVKAEEDTTFDSETGHTPEHVSYLAIGGQGMLTSWETRVSVGEVGRVTDLTHVPQVVELSRTYDHPVVFAQSASSYGSDPVIVRVTNVQSSRFTMYLAEPSNLDNEHNTVETVSYLVVEAGLHYLLDGTRLEVRTVETEATVGKIVDNRWQQVEFLNHFAETPVILTQIQTANGRNYLKTRQSTADKDGFAVALEQEEVISFQAVVPETIGFLAMEEGSGQWGNLEYEAAQTPVVITDQWTHHAFGPFFATPPGLLSSLSSYLGDDNAHVRYNHLDSRGVSLKIEEDTTRDLELVHAPEVISYLAIAGQGMLLATVPQFDIGEVGRISDLTHTPQVVTLQRRYQQPVVFAQSATSLGIEPVSIRIRNVGPNQFEIYLTEPSNLNQMHNTTESVNFLVLEKGVHRLSNGTRLEVGVVETNATVGNNLTNSASQVVDFASSFSATPVVLSQIQTVATGGAPYLQTRHLSVSTSSVSLALEQEEASTESHVTETVGYIAIEPGSGLWSGMAYETGMTAKVVTDAWHDLQFANIYADGPQLLTSLATYYGQDSAHLSYGNLMPDSVQIKITEDTTTDIETMHQTAEAVAYLAIGGSGVLTARSQFPPRVAMFIRDGGGDRYDRLEVMQYTFNEDVTVTVDALQLAHVEKISKLIELTDVTFFYDTNSRTATWDFSRVSRLEAGYYTASLDPPQIIDSSGFMLDGNGDGVAKDPYTHTFLVAQRGDSDLDGDIDSADFNTLKEYFDPLGTGGMNDWSRADFDGDGDVDVTNFYTAVKNFMPFGYTSRLTTQVEIVTTDFATVRLSESVKLSELLPRTDVSNTPLVADALWTDRAFATWDGDLTLPMARFVSRRRLLPIAKDE